MCFSSLQNKRRYRFYRFNSFSLNKNGVVLDVVLECCFYFFLIFLIFYFWSVVFKFSNVSWVSFYAGRWQNASPFLRRNIWPWSILRERLGLRRGWAGAGLPWWLPGKESACRAGIADVGFSPGSGRSPGDGHGNPLQYSCLENPMDRGAWRATVHRVANTIKTTLHARMHLWAPIQGRKLQCHPAGGFICLCSSGRRSGC